MAITGPICPVCGAYHTAGKWIEVTHQDKQIHGTDLSDGEKASFDAAVPAARLVSRKDVVTAVLVAIEKDAVRAGSGDVRDRSSRSLRFYMRKLEATSA